MTRPHPVIGVLSKISNRRWWSPNQAYIIITFCYKHEILVSFEERTDKYLLIVFFFYSLYQLSNIFFRLRLSFFFTHCASYTRQYLFTYIFYSYYKCYKQSRVWNFFII